MLRGQESEWSHLEQILEGYFFFKVSLFIKSNIIVIYIKSFLKGKLFYDVIRRQGDGGKFSLL